jgi:hypothetical protein
MKTILNENELKKYQPKGMRLYPSLHVRLLAKEHGKARIIPCDAIIDEKNVREMDLKEFEDGYEEFKR